MILFYSPGTCAFSEIVALEWCREPYRLCRLTRDERLGETYRGSVNPHGQVPALKLDDGEILTENAAILLLIADLHPEAELVPRPNTLNRYRMYRWLSWLDSGFHVSFYPHFKPQRYAAEDKEQERVRDHARVGIEASLRYMNDHLEGRDHVDFDRRTILDAYLFAMARWGEKLFDYPKEFPNLYRFLQNLRQDPGVIRGLDIEKGRVVDPEGPDDLFQGHIALADALKAD